MKLQILIGGREESACCSCTFRRSPSQKLHFFARVHFSLDFIAQTEAYYLCGFNFELLNFSSQPFLAPFKCKFFPLAEFYFKLLIQSSRSFKVISDK